MGLSITYCFNKPENTLRKLQKLEREFLRESFSIIEVILRFCKVPLPLIFALPSSILISILTNSAYMSIVPVSDQERSVSNSNNSTQDLWDPLALDLWNWDPFSDFPFPSPSHSLSTFFSPHYSPFGASVNTRLDWRETPRAHVLKLSVPNEDVLVELQDDRVLQVSVESGNFMSRFRIPDDGFIEQLKASMHNGVLTVVVPKVGASTSRPNIRVIDISG